MTNGLNGTTKKVIAGVLTAVIVFLFTQAVINSNRITALETDMVSLKDSVRALKQDNQADHRYIIDKIDKIYEATKR